MKKSGDCEYAGLVWYELQSKHLDQAADHDHDLICNCYCITAVIIIVTEKIKMEH